MAFVHLRVAELVGFLPRIKIILQPNNFYHGKGKHGHQANSVVCCKARLTRKERSAATELNFLAILMQYSSSLSLAWQAGI